MDALGKLLVGSLGTSHYGNTVAVQTQITTTVFMEAKEMQGVGSSNTGTRETISIANMSMIDVLEQVFANTTISMLSDSYFLQNMSEASNISVTIHTPQNAYHYGPRNLLLAYGIGIGVASVLVALGLVSIRASSASYGSSFSTILRTTRSPDFDDIVSAAEMSGVEPLPRRLGEIKISFRGGASKAGEREAGFTVVEARNHVVRSRNGRKRALSFDSLLQDEEHRASTQTTICVAQTQATINMYNTEGTVPT